MPRTNLLGGEGEGFKYLMEDLPQERLIIALGAIAAFAIPIVLTLAEPLTGGRSPQNALALTAFLFPLSIGIALVAEARDSELSLYDPESRVA